MNDEVMITAGEGRGQIATFSKGRSTEIEPHSEWFPEPNDAEGEGK
jgi:hypothetical protein